MPTRLDNTPIKSHNDKYIVINQCGHQVGGVYPTIEEAQKTALYCDANYSHSPYIVYKLTEVKEQ